MNRSGGETIIVAPKNNIYTVLAAISTVVLAVGLYVLITTANQLIPPGLFK